MHVVFLHRGTIPVFAYGGTERVIWDLGRALVELGHRVTYLVPPGSSCDFAAVRELRDDLPWEAQLPADADIAHFQFHPGSEPGFPHLVTEHGNSRGGQDFPLNTVFVSADHARRHGSTEFVLNGLDWRPYGPAHLEAPRAYFHFLGKAAWRVKNVQGAIDVALRAGQRLDVVGGTRLNLKRGFRFTWSRRIRFHGMLGGEAKSRVLAGSRGLIFPVRWHEPFGLAVIESLYFGCPVFATPYGALPELVPADCGVLSDRLDVLADALGAADHFSRAACHALATRHFSATRMALDYVAKYQRVLDGEPLNAQAPRLRDAFDDLPWRR